MTKEWNSGQPKGRWDPEPKSDAEDRAIQRGIDETMRQVIMDRYNPWAFGSMADPPKPRGTGWADAKPLESPPGQDHIRRLTEAFQPHGLANSENPLAKVVEEAVAKFKEAQEEKNKK